MNEIKKNHSFVPDIEISWLVYQVYIQKIYKLRYAFDS